jgi:hypothetical protein
MDAMTASPASTMSMITVHFAGVPGLPGRGDPRAAAVAVAVPQTPHARLFGCALRHVTGSGPRPGG